MTLCFSREETDRYLQFRNLKLTTACRRQIDQSNLFTTLQIRALLVSGSALIVSRVKVLRQEGEAFVQPVIIIGAAKADSGGPDSAHWAAGHRSKVTTGVGYRLARFLGRGGRTAVYQRIVDTLVEADANRIG